MRLVFVLVFALWSGGFLFGQCVPCMTGNTSSGCTIFINAPLNNPSFNLNAGDRLCIGPQGNLTGNWNVTINHPSATIVNDGTIAVNGFTLNQGTVINNGTIFSQNSIIVGNGALHNHGLVHSSGDFNLNAGSGFICNSDSIYVDNNFTTNGTVTNNGVFQVGGTFQQNTNGVWCSELFSLVRSEDLVLNGSVGGASAQCIGFIVADNTTVNSSGGISGTVDICDLNYTGSGPIPLDQPLGTIGSNVTYCGCGVTPLNIQGIEFEGIQNKEGIELRWKILPEQAFDQIALEMKAEGELDFEPVFYHSPLPSSADQDFQFYPDLPNSASTFFRLRATDFEGEVQFSQVLFFRPQPEDERPYFTIGPVPLEGDWKIEVGQLKGPAKLTLTDAVGSILFQTEWNPKSRAELKSFSAQRDLPPLPRGLYFFTLQSNGHTLCKRAIRP